MQYNEQKNQIRTSIEGERYVIAELPENVQSVVGTNDFSPTFGLYIKGEEWPVELKVSDELISNMFEPVKAVYVAQVSKINDRTIEAMKLISKPYFQEWLQYIGADKFKDALIIRVLDKEDDEYEEYK